MPNNLENKDIRSSLSFRSYTQNAGSDGRQQRIYTLNDYRWSDIPLISEINNLASLPKLVLTEFQPKKALDLSVIIKLVDNVAEAVGGGLAKITGGIGSSVIDVVKSGQEQISQVVGRTAINKTAQSYSSTENSEKLTDISEFLNIISGDVLNTYEIPFYGEEYLNAATKDNWSAGNAFEDAGNMATLMNDGFQMSMLRAPQWKNTFDEGHNWSNEFYLINDNVNNLYKNFKFLNSLTSSSYWVRMPWKAGLAISQSPNLFKVECPGRFMQLFVALDIKVTFAGKTRKSELYSKLGSSDSIGMIDENTLFPDAYKISIEAKDMTPNCFNIYMNYLRNGNSASVISSTATEVNADGFGTIGRELLSGNNSTP
jgi:hypothetical protein